MQDLKVLALQSDLEWENPAANRKQFEKKIESNFKDHDLIILPETFTTGFPVDPQLHAETENGHTIEWLKTISARYKSVITGSILLSNGDSFSNTLIWMEPNGNYHKYNKRHVFSMGGEHERIKPGNSYIITELKGWKIRPMICYDLRFPVWSKNRYNNGFEYDIAIYVANWPAVRSYPWKTLLLARSLENQAYIIGVNRIGVDAPGNNYSGDSMIVDPKGKIIAQGEEGKEMSLSATLSYEDIIKFREKFNVGVDWDDFEIKI